MIEGGWLWLTFVLLGATTLITRGSFILLGERATLPAIVQRALRYAPVAALSALVVPDLLLVEATFSPVNPKLLAGIAVVLVAWRWRNPWLPFIAGMGLLWTTRWLSTLF